MKLFWKFIFPILFGLLVYFSVRVVNDTTAHEKFWERDISLNAIEISSSILAGFIMIYTLNYLIKRFNSDKSKRIDHRTMIREFLIVFIVNIAIMCCTILPMAALTDDGLGLNDIAIINVISSLYALLYFAILRGNRYLQIYVAQKIQMEKISNDKLETELKFLKAQYHPHFLFNALNTVYFQMDENVGEAKKSIEKFSELLRYQLYDHQQTVPVSQEIEYLHNFIELQKLRSTDKLKLDLNIDKNLSDQIVYPLLFLPLVENAFKYVNGRYHISIDAVLENDQMGFKIRNSIGAASHAVAKTGIGLENLKRRLELLYPGKHSFSIEKTDSDFIADLRLQLK
jgi:hypothetical protein